MKSVSIIIPTYNRRHLIGMTLDSIFAQTLLPYEVIVVDDGSNDGTKEYLEEVYGGNRLKYIKNKGKGPGAARNTGLSIATGDYIKFFDSDDWMSPNSLEVQLKELEKTGKPYVTSPYIYASETNGQWHPIYNCTINYTGFPRHKPLTHWMIWGLFICIPTMLFRRDFLERIGPWPEEYITSEDWAYLWRIAMEEPYPTHVNNCWFYYRVHANQSTGENLNDTNRNREKYQILSQIYHKDFKGVYFNWFEKALFRNKFYQIARVTNDSIFKQELVKLAGRGQAIIWQYYRLKMKMGRIQTQTEWQPMHGISLQLPKYIYGN